MKLPVIKRPGVFLFENERDIHLKNQHLNSSKARIRDSLLGDSSSSFSRIKWEFKSLFCK